jgi:hypothetical protein
MNRIPFRAHFVFLIAFAWPLHAHANENVNVTQISPTLLVFATSTGNVVASVGPDGALLIGTPSAASTPTIAKILAQRTKSPTRYVVVFPSNPGHSQGDAGWGRLGAFVAMQENALQRIGGNRMGAPTPLPPRLRQLGVDRPRIAFSEVLAFDLNGEAIHIVRQSPGYSNADAIAHFHVANVIYLGNLFPGDSYPEIDTSQGGTLDGLIKTLDAWTDLKFRIVPQYGKPTTGAAVNAYREMITTVRDRVQRLIQEHKSEAEIVAVHPSAEFDAKYGRGPIGPDAFIHELYQALTAR